MTLRMCCIQNDKQSVKIQSDSYDCDAFHLDMFGKAFLFDLFATFIERRVERGQVMTEKKMKGMGKGNVARQTQTCITRTGTTFVCGVCALSPTRKLGVN